jgi:hypothetical protein
MVDGMTVTVYHWDTESLTSYQMDWRPGYAWPYLKDKLKMPWLTG